MAEFQCAIHIPDQPGLETDDLTVGRVFDLECAGPWPAGVDPKKYQTFFPKPDASDAPKPDAAASPAPSPYSLKFLDANASSKDAVTFKAVSYTAGPVEIPSLKITDGSSVLELGALRFEVRSVLDPQQPKQEPYGPFGAIGIGIPASWWMILACAVALLALAVFWRVRRRLQRRALMKRLREHDSALAPIAEFYARDRKLKRDHPLFAGMEGAPGDAAAATAELERTFRVYFMRRFRLPTLEWGDGALLRAFRAEHRALWDAAGDDVRKLFREFEAARKAKALDPKDVMQLERSARALIEKLERERTPRAKGRA